MQCPKSTKKVLIHDAARAFVNHEIIDRCIKGLESSDAISTAISVFDTVVKVKHGVIIEIPNRNMIFLEQTPQAFNYKVILAAHKEITTDATDDITLAKEYGIECTIVQGSSKNFKVTTPQDFKLAQFLIKGNK